MKKKKLNVSLLVAIIFLGLGISVFSYPVISNYLTEKNQSKVIDIYNEKISKESAEEIEKELYRAENYNEELIETSVYDPFNAENETNTSSNYMYILNIDGVMGYINIPKISVNAPIYHGTSDEAMKKGIGHIESTSLPVGGSSTHTVLTGHRGLPSAELFTRLDEITKGDYFFITVLNRRLAYKVYDIQTVLPVEMESLQIEKEKDLATLVTCTPYGVNTHRLLIHGERTNENISPNDIKNEPKKYDISQFNYTTWGMAMVLILVIVTLIIILINIILSSKRRENNDR